MDPSRRSIGAETTSTPLRVPFTEHKLVDRLEIPSVPNQQEDLMAGGGDNDLQSVKEMSVGNAAAARGGGEVATHTTGIRAVYSRGDHDDMRSTNIGLDSIATASLMSDFGTTPHSFEDSGSTLMVDSTTLLVSSSDNNDRQFRSPSVRKSNSTDSITLTKLNYKGLGLYARDKEIQTLDAILDAARSLQPRKQLVLLSGYSGVGKTTLAITLKPKVCPLEKNGILIKGKFDHEPYSGIKSACGDLCAQLLSLQQQQQQQQQQQEHQTNHNILDETREKLNAALGPDMSILTRVIPVLEEVLVVAHEKGKENNLVTTNESSESAAKSKNQFNFVFQRFIRAMSDMFSPLILVLDDLQWCDAASLDLLESIMTDYDNANIVVVGIYRSNEVDDQHLISRLLRELRPRAAKEQVFDMKEIQIGDLKLEDVRQFVCDILRSQESRLLSLAEISYKRTHGNPYFLLQLFAMLVDQCLLQFNLSRLKWEWDDAEIAERTMASENVVDLLKEKMVQLPPEEIQKLCLAACLGASFKKTTLEVVLEEAFGVTEPQGSSLNVLEAEGYLRYTEGRDEITFTHDKVQEAAVELIVNRGEFFQKVGNALVTKLPEDAGLFVAVDLLNNGDAPSDTADRLRLARLNQKACSKAVTVSAFETAAGYAAKGLNLVGKNGLEEHYELTLNLLSDGAEAESCCGNTDRMESYFRRVYEIDRPVEDKLRIVTTWFDHVGTQGRHAEAINVALSVLRNLGCGFPRTSPGIYFHVVARIVKFKRFIKKRGLETLNTLEAVQDPTRLQLMKLMDRLVTTMYIAGHALLPLAEFRCLEWSLQFGLSDYTAPALAATAIYFSGVLEDFHTSAEFAQTSLELSRGVSTEGRAIHMAWGFALHWSMPFRDQIKPMIRAYEQCLRAGDTWMACVSIHVFSIARFAASFSLEVTTADVATYTRQMNSFGHTIVAVCSSLHLQVFRNIMGQSSSNHLSIVGEYFSQEHLETWKDNVFFMSQYHMWRGVLHALFGDYKACADLALDVGMTSYAKLNAGSVLQYIETLWKGLSFFVMARKTKKRKYRRAAMFMHKRVKRWIEKGNPNVTHFKMLFDAELDVLRGKMHSARQAYQSAIIVCARMGALVEAGVCSERLGDFYLEMGDSAEATFRFDQAIKYYKDFGAHRKASSLVDAYSHLWNKPVEVVALDPEVHNPLDAN